MTTLIGDNGKVIQTLLDAAQNDYQRSCDMQAPSMMWRPRIFIDGNQWCALYGDNIQDGVAGFGDTPEKAMSDFDIQWLNAKAAQPAPEPLRCVGCGHKPHKASRCFKTQDADHTLWCECICDLDDEQPTAAPATAPRHDPTEADLADPVFNAIWSVIKKWDVSTENSGLYSGATGTDVMMILDAVRAATAPQQEESK